MENLGIMSAFVDITDFLAVTLLESSRRGRVKLFQKDGDGRRSASTLALQPPCSICALFIVAILQGHI
jgi:hypothetical protein